MSDAKTVQHTQSGLRSRFAVIFAACLLLTGAGALWWRFGEGVFVTSMVNMIIACF